MISLTPTFEAELIKKSRRPVQLAHFILPDRTVYLSDKVVGTADGLFNDYSPMVESWGTLSDSTSLNDLFKGGALEIRSGTLTLINSVSAHTFVKELFALGIENTKVELYQWFAGLEDADKTLIDIMVCQDPIKVAEASMLLSIDLVSVIMQNNPYLYTRAYGESKYPVVIGKAVGVPLIDLQTARWTSLVEDIEDGSGGTETLGEYLIENGVGFPASGNMYIDSELVTYDWISAAGINITARAQGGTEISKHWRGARLTIPNAAYDYGICAGSVSLVDNLIANGEPYENDVTFLVAQDPVIARFIHRPPWLKVETTEGGDTQPDDVILTDQWAASYDYDYGDGATVIGGGSNINQELFAATMSISNTVGGGWVYGYQTTVLNPITTDIVNAFKGSTPSGWQDMLEYEDAVDLVLKIHEYNDLFTNDGVSAAISGIFTGDLTGLGSEIDPNTVKLTISYTDCLVRRSDASLVVSFRNASGGTHVLENVDLSDHTDGAGYTTRAPFSNRKEVYENIPISDLVGFTNAGVKLDYLNTWVSDDLTWNAYTRGELGISYFEFTFDYLIPSGTVQQPWQDLVSHFNRDFSDLGGLERVSVTVRVGTTADCENTIEIVQRSTSDTVDNVTLQTLSPGDVAEYGPFTLISGGGSWSALQALRIGLFHQITGPDTEGLTRKLDTSFEWVKWEIEYTPGVIPNPDEKRVVYADDAFCDVTSEFGENPTPPQVVRHFIENYSPDGVSYTDDNSFDAQHARYTADSYFINGLIDGSYKLHDGLRKILFEGMLRLLFNEGKIKLLSYATEADLTVDAVIDNSEVLIKSRTIENQPITLIKNDVTVIYDYNISEGTYNNEVRVTDDVSIVRFNSQEERRQYDLIHSESIATLIADRLLALYHLPVSVSNFKVFMPVGFKLEKGDRVTIPSFMDRRVTLNGAVLSMRRRFASGKNSQINVYQVTLANPQPLTVLKLEEALVVDDLAFAKSLGFIIPAEVLAFSDDEFLSEKIVSLPFDTFGINEELILNTCTPAGYGTCGYGVSPYGQSNLGPELVANYHFLNGLDDWTTLTQGVGQTYSDGISSVVLTFIGPLNRGLVYQDIILPIDPGVTYILTAVNTSARECELLDGFGIFPTQTIPPYSTIQFAFSMTTTDKYRVMAGPTDTGQGEAFIDLISIREIL